MDTKLPQTEIRFLQARVAELEAENHRLRRSEQRYRQILDLANEGIYRFEYEEPISLQIPIEEQVQRVYQYQVQEHNQVYAQMFGYDEPDALIGARLCDFHIADVPENRKQIQRYVEHGHQMKNFETVEVDRCGRRRYFLNNGAASIKDGCAVGGWGTQIDITELRETQQGLIDTERARAAELARANEELQQALDHLSESEYRYRTLFELSNEGIYRFELEEPIAADLPVEEQVRLTFERWRLAEAIVFLDKNENQWPTA